MRKSIFTAVLVCLMIATVTILSGAFIFVGQTQAAGNTYYVATIGNNTNPGTSTQPWRTIQYAADTAGAGDTVIIQAGTYNERVAITRGGGASAYTVFKADPARSVNMNGFRLDAQYVKVEGFKVSGVGDTAFDVGASNLVIENNEVIENRSMGVGTWDPSATYSNVVIRNNYIYRSAYGVVAAGDGWLIEGNEVERLISYGEGDNDYMRFFGRNHLFRRNYLHGTRESEICPPSWTGPFDPRYCAHVDGFQTFSNNNYTANNVTFDGNFVIDFHQGATVQNNNGYMNISGLIFRNNIFVGGTSSTISASWGIQMNSLINTTIENNYFFNVGAAIDMSTANTGTIRNNIFNSASGVPYVLSGQTSSTAVKGGNNINYKSNQNVWCWQCGSIDVPLPGDTFNSNIRMINPDNPLGVDGKPFTADDGYRLLEGSPAIDAGQVSGATTDIFGTSRPVGSKVDVGPYEFGSSSITPPPACTPNWSCTNFGTCSGGQQSRTCTDLNSCGAITGRPVLTQSCTVSPSCTPNWTCSDWNSCGTNRQQSRTCTDSNNCGTTTGRPVLAQSCTPRVCTPSWSCTDFSVCSANGNQIRTCTDANSCGVSTNKPVEAQSCTIPGTMPPVCTPNWSCTAWDICTINNPQARRCQDLNKCNLDANQPKLTQDCKFPVTRPNPCVSRWSCTGWNACGINSQQNRICMDVNKCDVATNKPAESQSCRYAPPVCVSSWICSDWSVCSASKLQSRSCADANHCDRPLGRPTVVQSCVPSTIMPIAGHLIRLQCGQMSGSTEVCRTVYYLASNGKRYAFPNEKTYRSWNEDFRSVTALTTSQLTASPLGGVVTNRPGARLVKFDTDPKVYAVSRGGVLHWVTSEETARQLYGLNWSRQIDDIPAWLVTTYTFGSDISNAVEYNPAATLLEAVNINYDKGFTF